jgi:pSer/pThr/pTyr-binding forkhead associated (FHA) protein
MSSSTSNSWTRPPQHAWTIDEVKQGNIITTYSLNDIIQTQNSRNTFPSITFGRIADDPSLVDIVTAHESCSRQHARIAFDCHGTPWLRDLGSGNGTFVNEKRLPPEACGKIYDSQNSNKKGSRGVVLFPGDAIRFGASTRIYIIEGPEEFERGASKQRVDEEGSRAASTTHNHFETTTPQHSDGDAPADAPTEDTGCSWGMAADDDVPLTTEEQRVIDTGDLPPLPSIDSFFFSPSEKYQIPNSLHQLHNQYNTKIHKLQSIQTESQRIIQKEHMGVELTEGQRGQLGKNQERITTLEKDIATLKEKIEDGMFNIIHGKERGRKRPREDNNQYNAEDDDDVDCFYDRTTSSSSKRRQHKTTAAVESEATLIQKWKSLLDGHAKQRQLAVRASERCSGLQKLIDDATEDADDLFFLQNDLSLANENLCKAYKTVEEIENELDECEYLLKTVNGKLVWDRKEGVIGTNIVMKGEASVVDDAKRLSSQMEFGGRAAEDDSIAMPPPPPTSVMAVTASDMPPPPPMTIRKPTPEGNLTSSVLSDAPEPQKKKTIGPSRPPVQGTLAALKQASLPRSNEAKLQTTESAVMTPVETQKDEWKAPIDQDGSGRTALHDKFKGRY